MARASKPLHLPDRAALILEDRAAQTTQVLFGAGRICPASIVAR
jgi:hypothetical protein